MKKRHNSEQEKPYKVKTRSGWRRQSEIKSDVCPKPHNLAWRFTGERCCFWTSFRIHYGSLSSCHKRTSWAVTTFKLRRDLSLKQPSEMCLQFWNTFCQHFSVHPSQNGVFFPLPPLEPTPPHKHTLPPIKHACVCVCVRECPPPSVSPWLDCGSSSAPCGRVELWLSSTSSVFSTYPQVHFPGIPKPPHPLWR